jgi:hypothetical protein
MSQIIGDSVAARSTCKAKLNLEFILLYEYRQTRGSLYKMLYQLGGVELELVKKTRKSRFCPIFFARVQLCATEELCHFLGHNGPELGSIAWYRYRQASSRTSVRSARELQDMESTKQSAMKSRLGQKRELSQFRG